jgi:hypothetical protein
MNKAAHLRQAPFFWHLRHEWLHWAGAFLAGSVFAAALVMLSQMLNGAV